MSEEQTSRKRRKLLELAADRVVDEKNDQPHEVEGAVLSEQADSNSSSGFSNDSGGDLGRDFDSDASCDSEAETVICPIRTNSENQRRADNSRDVKDGSASPQAAEILQPTSQVQARFLKPPSKRIASEPIESAHDNAGPAASVNPSSG